MTEAEAAVPQDVVDESSELPPEEEVIVELQKLLENADFSTTTERMLREKLEHHFGVGLKSMKAVIREQVKAYIDQHAEASREDEEEGDEEEEEEDDSRRKRKPSAGASKKRKGATSDKEPKRRAVATSTAILSPELQAFLGEETLPRTQIVKKIWEHIKANNLQNPKNKRQIILDDTLKTLFSPPIDMFSMNKQLSKHIKTAD